MDLASIFDMYLIESKTGQLLIKFEGEKYLCKVHVENGSALYISLGNKTPDETIAHIDGMRPVEANFIDGMPALKKLDEPLNHKLFSLAGSLHGAPGVSESFTSGSGSIYREEAPTQHRYGGLPQENINEE